MGFVHSCRDLGLFLRSYSFDSSRDCWLLIYLGQFVLPWTVLLHVPLHILDQIGPAFPFVVPCTFVVYIIEGLLNGIRAWTIRQYPDRRTPVQLQELRGRLWTSPSKGDGTAMETSMKTLSSPRRMQQV
jgi:hypothetical protein